MWTALQIWSTGRAADGAAPFFTVGGDGCRVLPLVFPCIAYSLHDCRKLSMVDGAAGRGTPRTTANSQSWLGPVGASATC